MLCCKPLPPSPWFFDIFACGYQPATGLQATFHFSSSSSVEFKDLRTCVKVVGLNLRTTGSRKKGQQFKSRNGWQWYFFLQNIMTYKLQPLLSYDTESFTSSDATGHQDNFLLHFRRLTRNSSGRARDNNNPLANSVSSVSSGFHSNSSDVITHQQQG